MLNMNSIMVGTEKIQQMAEFYEHVFEKKADMVEGSFYGWSVGNCFFSVGEHSEVKGNSKEPQRIIINLETKEVKEQFARIKALGAVVVKEPYQMGPAWIATLQDPDGNYFQLMTPWEQNS